MRGAAAIAAAGLALTLLPTGAARASRTLTAPPTASFAATLDGSDQTVTFALQGHDPNSIVHYKNIRVKPLP